MPTENTFRFDHHNDSVRLHEGVCQPALALGLPISEGNSLQPLFAILRNDNSLAESTHSPIRAVVGSYAQGHCRILLNLLAFQSTKTRCEVKDTIVVHVPDWSYARLAVS